MIVARALLAAAALAAAPSAQAQTPPPYLAPGVDLHRYQADQHHHEIDRLRARADQREAFARQLQLETRLNRLEIEAARQAEPAPPPPYRVLRSPEEERALRESATRRRLATTAGVTQIDAWLDRSAR
ncbi:hypothetical protein [Brevundimonas sp.]|uniref:hypothetical protein n=1 Tax=Brevundimonas sp. TaxID=1871086 RepID=UPI002D3AA597|nr:hypothetical protein [Brevundimonas sp.]HYC98972.1 hypothetical protein [Brevundimonas sp.]